MGPSVPHNVTNIDDCLASCVHYYSLMNLRNLLRGLMLERYFGELCTNTEHSSSGIVFFKFLSYLCMMQEYKKAGVPFVEGESKLLYV